MERKSSKPRRVKAAPKQPDRETGERGPDEREPADPHQKLREHLKKTAPRRSYLNTEG